MQLHNWTLEQSVFIHQLSGITITQFSSKWVVCSKSSDIPKILGTLSEAFSFAEELLNNQKNSFQISLLELRLKYIRLNTFLVAITQNSIVTHYTLSGKVVIDFKSTIHTLKQSNIAREKQIRVDIKDIDNYPEPLIFNNELLLVAPVVLIDMKGNLSVAKLTYKLQLNSSKYTYSIYQGSKQLYSQHYSEIIFL